MSNPSASLDGIKAVFLDLDGTIYLGSNLIDGVQSFLDRLEERGIMRFFLSNNSSKSVGQYLEKLQDWVSLQIRKKFSYPHTI